MSKEIDERVVEMRFDNQQFEKNVQTSIGTLDKLRSSLDFSGASKGFDELNSEAKKVDFSPLGEGIEAVKVKFSALQIMGATALENITNSIVNYGKKVVSAFTVTPVKSGFEEYETQMDAVQTILANTSSRQKEVSKELVAEINSAASEMTAATKKANKQALEDFKDSQKKELEEYQKTADAETSILKESNEQTLEDLKKIHKQELSEYEKKSSDEIDILKEKNNQALEELKYAQKKQLEELKDAADEELKVLEKKYADESEALKSALDAESTALKAAHNEKLDLYQEEYMEKLKVIDEERYEKLKLIDEEIAAINGLTKSENEAREAEKQRLKLAELEASVVNSKSEEARMKAEAKLSEYKEELARKELLKQREQQIQQLKNSKDAVNAEYDLKAQEAKKELDEQKKAENELYELSSKNLKDEYTEKSKTLKETYNEEKTLLKQLSADEEEALKEQQSEELKIFSKTCDEELKALKSRQAEEKAAIEERQSLESSSLKKSNDEALKLLKERQKEEKSAIEARQKLELSALKESHEAALKNIEAEKSAKLAAARTAAAAEMTKGSTLEDVNAALNELNHYADKTIYNFTQMTRNIGTFTAAGIDLETSVSAIQGIANLAAVSGSTSQQASTAMYQLSQALAAGTVKLQDWNSVVNAGMGGQIFQDALKKTSRLLGTGVDEAIDATGSFRESLQKGWLTAEVLTETLKKFTTSGASEYVAEYTGLSKDAVDAAIEAAKAQHGEANAIKEASKALAEKTGKDAEEIEAVLSMARTAEDAATKVKTFSQLMDTLGEAAQSGWTQTWQISIGDFEEAKELWTTVSDVFGDIINASADARNSMLQGWSDLGGRTVLIEALKNAFEGLVSIVSPIKEAFREIFPPTTSEQLMRFTETLRDMTARLKLSETQAEKLKTAFKGFFSIIDIGLTAVKAVIGVIISLIKNLSGLDDGLLSAAAAMGGWTSKLRESIKETDAFGKAASKVGEILGKIIGTIKAFAIAVKQKIEAKGFQAFLDILKGIWGFMQKIADALKKVASLIMSALKDVLKIDGLGSLFDIINGGLFTVILANAVKFVKGLSDTFGGLKDILGGVTGVLDGVKGSLEAWQQNLKAKTLKELATAIAILAAALLVISTIDSNKLTSSLGGITVLFVEMVAALSVINKLNMNLKGATKTIAMMNGLATAVLILASALKKISSLDWGELAVGLTGMLALIAMLVASAAALSKIEGRVMKGATSIVIFSAAINILASACADMAKLSWSGLIKGLTGVGVLLLELDIFLRTAKMSGKAMLTSLGMIELGAAIKILASAAGDFAEMNWGEVSRGLSAIGILLAEITAFTKLTGNAKHVVSTGLSLIEIGAAMKIFASAVSDFGNMEWGSIAKGLIGMAGSLTAVTVAVKLMPKNMVGIGTGLILVGTALNIMAPALRSMGNMSWESVAKGLIALGGSLGILAVGLNAMKGTAAASASLSIAATGLLALTPVLKTLGGMSMKEIASALSALAGAFIVLGTATAILKPLAGTMVKIAGAITLFGTGCAIAGAGILAVSVALTAFSASMVVLAASVTEVIVGLCNGIANSAEAISRAFVALIKAACVSITETAPYVADALLKMLVQTLSSLKDYIPQVVDLVMDILIQLFDKLALRIPELVSSAVNMLGKFVESINEALGEGGWEKLLLSITAISAIFLALAETAKIISTIEVKGAVSGLAGFALVVAGLATVLAALGALSQIPGLSWIISEGSKILSSIGYALGGLVGGLVNGLVSNMPSDLMQFATAFAEIAAIIAALAPAAKAIKGVDVAGTAKGIAGIGTFIGGIAGILAALGALNQIPGFSWIIGEGASVLSLLGTAIGTAVGSIVEGLTSAVKSDLKRVANAAASISTVILAAAGIGKVLSTLKLDVKTVAIGGAAVVVLIGEIAALLAALGALNQIPGFDWIMTGGAEVLGKIGGAIGNFVGSIVSGLGVGLTSGLPAMGKNLSDFMSSLKPFIDGAKSIDASVAAGIGALALAVLEITAADIISGIASFITGGSSLSTFGRELSSFGPQLVSFSKSVEGINTDNIEAAAEAAAAMADMAAAIPNEGGLVSLFTGDNSLSKWGPQLSGFGKNLKEFADNVKGIEPQNILAAADAGKALAQMAQAIPNEGGLISLLTGDNSLESWGPQLAGFGTNLKDFAKNVEGIEPDNILAAAEAGEALAKMSETIPNEGGIVSWFAGDNSLASWGPQIADFGKDFKSFSDNIKGIEPENILAAAKAGKALAEMADNVPNEGGIVSWFAGDNSLASWGPEIASFGKDFKSFSDNIEGINSENVEAAAESGKKLAEMADNVPNQGGIQAWFAGEKSVANFGTEIASFGKDFKSFSDNIEGINPENVAAAAESGKKLAEMADNVPSEGGIVSWFAGEKSVANFGKELAGFGTYFKKFSDNVSGIDPENVGFAAEAGKKLAEMTSNIPSAGGLVQWFTGDKSLAKFGPQIADFGKDLWRFSFNTNGINTTNVSAAAEAGKKLVEMTNNVPSSGGVTQWWCGEKSLSNFADDIVDFGKALSKFSNNVSDVNPEKTAAATDAGLKVVEILNTDIDSDNLKDYVVALELVASQTAKFVDAFSEINVRNATYQVSQVTSVLSILNEASRNIDTNTITASVNICRSLVELINDMSSRQISVSSYTDAFATTGESILSFSTVVSTANIQNAVNQVDLIISMMNRINETSSQGLRNLGEALNTAGTDGVTKFVEAFKDGESKVKEAVTGFINSAVAVISNTNANFESAGQETISKFVDGAKAQEEYAKKTFASLAGRFLDVLKDRYPEYETAGKAIVSNLITGVESQDSSLKASLSSVFSRGLAVIKDKFNEFTNAGENSIINLISGVKSKEDSAKNAYSNLIALCLTVIKNKFAEFESSGAKTVSSLIIGIESKQEDLRIATVVLISVSLDAIKDYYSEFKSAGEKLMNEFVSGISKGASVSDKFNSELSTAVASIKSYRTGFRAAGEYLVDGFVSGIDGYIDRAASKAAEMARAALNAVEKELDIHSPSKAAYKDGAFTGMGFVNALEDYGKKSYRAGTEFAEYAREGIASAVSKISDEISNGIDARPRITPVLDLSEIGVGVHDIDAMLSRNQALTIGADMNQRGRQSDTVQNTPEGANGNISFVQNNYSPKALSRIEIYRQTNNQISRLRGMVKQ